MILFKHNLYTKELWQFAYIIHHFVANLPFKNKNSLIFWLKGQIHAISLALFIFRFPCFQNAVAAIVPIYYGRYQQHA